VLFRSESIRKEIQNDNIETLKAEIENLKTAMKDMIEAKLGDNGSNSDPMSNLNDL
jgi:hypothetical protein